MVAFNYPSFCIWECCMDAICHWSMLALNQVCLVQTQRLENISLFGCGILLKVSEVPRIYFLPCSEHHNEFFIPHCLSLVLFTMIRSPGTSTKENSTGLWKIKIDQTPYGISAPEPLDLISLLFMYIQIKYHLRLFVLIIDFWQECYKHKSHDLPFQTPLLEPQLRISKEWKGSGRGASFVLLLEDRPLEKARQCCVCLFSRKGECHAHFFGNLLWLASQL